MGWINIIKPLLSTALSSSAGKKFLGTPGIDPGAAGCKAITLSIMLCGPHNVFFKRLLSHISNLYKNCVTLQ